MRLPVKVVPRSSRNGVIGWMGKALKVCVTAAPERGRANEAVCETLAAALGVPNRQVQVVSGHAAARKIVEIEGLEEAEVHDKFRGKI